MASEHAYDQFPFLLRGSGAFLIFAIATAAWSKYRFKPFSTKAFDAYELGAIPTAVDVFMVPWLLRNLYIAALFCFSAPSVWRSFTFFHIRVAAWRAPLWWHQMLNFCLHWFPHENTRACVAQNLKVYFTLTSSCAIGPAVSEEMASRGAYLFLDLFTNGLRLVLPFTHASHDTLPLSSQWSTKTLTASGYSDFNHLSLLAAEWLNVLWRFMFCIFRAIAGAANLFFIFPQERKACKGCRLLRLLWCSCLIVWRRGSVSNTVFFEDYSCFIANCPKLMRFYEKAGAQKVGK